MILSRSKEEGMSENKPNKASKLSAQSASIRRGIKNYDAVYKQLLSHRPLLAYIMRNTLPEYRNEPLESIVSYIEDLKTPLSTRGG